MVLSLSTTSLENNILCMDALCRLCGSDEGIRVSIFEPGTEHVKKIHKILPITVNEHDPFPKTMCHRCSFKVNEFFEFRTNCIKAQELFKRKVPWLRDKQATVVDSGHPPMVEVPLNSVNAVSPNEKDISGGINNVNNENEQMIIIDDDSPPYAEELRALSPVLREEESPHQKLLMRIKKSDIKKKSKSRSIWDTKKRKRRSHKTHRIAEVYTSCMDEDQSAGDIENDPLCLSPDDKNENNETYSYLTKSPKNERNNVEMSVLRDEKKGENITLPKHILVTNIPRVGFVYTCEKCGRTFLVPQSASLHTCDEVTGYSENDRSKESVAPVSSNSDVYSCNQCCKVFSRQSQLLSHQKKHYKKDSSSEDNFIPLNRKRKHHTKKKSKPRIFDSNSFLMSFDQREPSITRHALLSSDSE